MHKYTENVILQAFFMGKNRAHRTPHTCSLQHEKVKMNYAHTTATFTHLFNLLAGHFFTNFRSKSLVTTS